LKRLGLSVKSVLYSASASAGLTLCKQNICVHFTRWDINFSLSYPILLISGGGEVRKSFGM